MATVRAENFDAGMFGKLVALFDSNNAGEAENSFRKAVLLCAKYGLHFSEAAAMAFGHDGGEAEDLREQLREQEAEHASQLTEAAAVVERLRGEVDELRAELAGDTPEGEHVIDLPGRLRRASRFAQFRLLVLTVMIAALYGVADHSDALAWLFGAVCLFLFGAWSVAQFHKRGLGQMFLKWIVYGALLMPRGMFVDSFHAGTGPPYFSAFWPWRWC